MILDRSCPHQPLQIGFHKMQRFLWIGRIWYAGGKICSIIGIYYCTHCLSRKYIKILGGKGNNADSNMDYTLWGNVEFLGRSKWNWNKRKWHKIWQNKNRKRCQAGSLSSTLAGRSFSGLCIRKGSSILVLPVGTWTWDLLHAGVGPPSYSLFLALHQGP